MLAGVALPRRRAPVLPAAWCLLPLAKLAPPMDGMVPSPAGNPSRTSAGMVPDLTLPASRQHGCEHQPLLTMLLVQRL
jgi:hypothetical protein